MEFPAGLIDAGEDPEQAALRELAEETGYGPKAFPQTKGQVVECSKVCADSPGGLRRKTKAVDTFCPILQLRRGGGKHLNALACLLQACRPRPPYSFPFEWSLMATQKDILSPSKTWTKENSCVQCKVRACLCLCRSESLMMFRFRTDREADRVHQRWVVHVICLRRHSPLIQAEMYELPSQTSTRLCEPTKTLGMSSIPVCTTLPTG